MKKKVLLISRFNYLLYIIISAMNCEYLLASKEFREKDMCNPRYIKCIGVLHAEDILVSIYCSYNAYLW